MAQKVNTITNLIGNLVSNRFAIGQSYNIQSPSLTMSVEKMQASSLPSVFNLQNAKVIFPTFCDLVTQSTAATTTMAAISPYINLADASNCTNRVITLKSILLPMALSGHNGRNESLVGYSYGLDLCFLDENGNEIDVHDTLKPIQMYIPRDSNLPYDQYEFVNTSNFTVTSENQILPNAMRIYGTNASLHIQIKPVNESVAYLILVKFGSTPLLNATTSSYDFWEILCPNSTNSYTVLDSTTGALLDSYYLVFMSQKTVVYQFYSYNLVI